MVTKTFTIGAIIDNVTVGVFTGTNRKTTYVSLAGTAPNVLQGLANRGINKDQVVEMKNDGTFAVYSRR